MLQVLRQGKPVRFGQCRETRFNLGREVDSYGHWSFLVDSSKSIAYAAKYSTIKPLDHLKPAHGLRPSSTCGSSFKGDDFTITDVRGLRLNLPPAPEAP